jgi:hypothetical protein
MKHLSFIYAIVGFCFASDLMAQSVDTIGNSDAAKIIRDWKFIAHENIAVRPVKFPQRKFDSPFFCDELIPFKKGFVINSIATSPGGGGMTDIQTKFYYYDLPTGRLSLLTIPNVDTIETVIGDTQDGLICVYKAKHGNVISRFARQQEENLTADAPEIVKNGLDTARWIKLGSRGVTLVALTPNAVYTFSHGRWDETVRYSLSQFFPKQKYRRIPSLLPTRNILVADSCIWFLHEIVQARSCRLIRLDLQTGQIADFFSILGYTDNYDKQIFDYGLLPDHSLLVTASRLMGNFMVLNALDGNSEVWTFNNKTKPQAGEQEATTVAPWDAANDETAVAISTIALAGDTVYLAGINGLFKKYQDRLTTVMRWNNTHQTVEKNIDFEFVPRCLHVLPGNLFLIGGLYGGLYIADPAKSKIRWLDDAAYKRINKIDLRTW